VAGEERPALAGVNVRPQAAVPARVLAIVVPVIVAGSAALGLAVYRYASSSPSARDLAYLFGLFASMVVAERFPVPLEGLSTGGMTLGFIFSVSAIILLGWPAGVIIAAGAPTFTHLVLQRRPVLRAAYNGAMFALSALVAGLAVEQLHGNSVPMLIARVVLCSVAYYWVVNLVLISAVLSADTGRSFFAIARENITQTAAPFAFMVSAALALIVLWQRQPVLSISLVGPLLAIALYQRSTFKAMQAMRLALTDPLTGLGNHRSFHERLQRELVVAEHEGSSLALCLVDFDDLKSVNDQFGHPVGDLVLGQVAARLRQGGEAFRLGGDEFAVLLPRQDERQATAVARSIVERVAALNVAGVGPVTVSAGVATYPMHGTSRDELIRLADSALYWAKKDGKNRVRAYAAESILRANLEHIADMPDRAAQYRAAESLAKAVDERDAYT
jgi:diguanylate cyclase (GGDEF)-like protein